jgi:hypothetical protein
MDQPYRADWLSKFHTWPEPIQALWLVAVPATLLGLAWLVLRFARDLVSLWRGHPEWPPRLIYGVYRDRRGRWMIYRHGQDPQEIDPHNPLPELIGRGLRSGLTAPDA